MPLLDSDPGKEFPGGKTLWEWLGEPTRPQAEGETRRDVLKMMGLGLSAAVGAAAGCRIPERRALPLVSQPEDLVPGVADYYATTCGGCAAGCGLLVKVRDGRPIKIEGNPDSPISRGGTCAAGQATVLSLYDDERHRGPFWLGKPTTWSAIDAAISARLVAVAARGHRIVLLTGSGLGPSFRRLLEKWRERYPDTRHLVHEPLSTAAIRTANERSFGQAVVPRHRFDLAKRVVALEADFLGTWLSPVEATRRYAAARRVSPGAGGSEGAGGPGNMPRHVQIESQMTLSGSNADLRIPVLPSEVGLAALALLAAVGHLSGAKEPIENLAKKSWSAALDLVAADLWAHRSESLVICGENNPAVQRIVNRINARLGNVGRTLDLDRPSHQTEGDEAAVAGLIDEMERGEIGAILLLGVNPVYDHPQGARFARALERVPLSVSFSDRPDETSEHVHALCPDVHFLEGWNDSEPIAGCLQLSQPTIALLFDARPAPESLLRWAGLADAPPGPAGAPGPWYDFLRERWRAEVLPRQSRFATFDALWDASLERGVHLADADVEAPPAGRLFEDQSTPAEIAALARQIVRAAGTPRDGAERIELRLYPSIALGDGRAANNPWLQELPDPLAKTTWGNTVAVAPALAARLELVDGDVVALSSADGKARIELPVVIQPGLPDQAVAVALGYGRTRAGKVGNGIGANAFPFRPAVEGFARNARHDVRLEKTGRIEPLARTQQHFSLEGRDIIREVAVADLGRGFDGLLAPEPAADLWPEHEKPEHFWGMAIDLSACTGCSACLIACQAENNVAVVGKDEVARGREMHWLRIDRYYDGGQDEIRSLHQPMMCQHCDHAPCETVCPVLATVHSSDGLNQQVYNRCIGTRYCANNCPYKVRRFNWFQYAENDRFDYTMNGELPRMVLNPDVGIRSRGVMEKCSMCIQRIQAGKLDAKRRGDALRDGAIETACQQACPADAIVFGDGADPQSTLSERRRDPRFYRVLEEVGTRPGVGYLAKVRNGFPERA